MFNNNWDGIVEVCLIVTGLSYKDKGEIRDLALGDNTNTLSGFSSVITDVKEEITEVYFIQDTESSMEQNYMLHHQRRFI